MENSTITFITDQLKALTSIPSPSGFTKEVAQYLVSTLEEMGFTPERSRKGNVCVTIGGEGSPLILAAHVDTLGAMVRSIKSNGRLRPTTLGGHQWCTADGENCTVHTRDGKVYTGVVLNKEPSAHVADQKVEATEENMEILLDENVSTEKDVKELGIQLLDIYKETYFFLHHSNTNEDEFIEFLLRNDMTHRELQGYGFPLRKIQFISKQIRGEENGETTN